MAPPLVFAKRTAAPIEMSRSIVSLESGGREIQVPRCSGNRLPRSSTRRTALALNSTVKLLRARRGFFGFDSASIEDTVSPVRSVSTSRDHPIVEGQKQGVLPPELRRHVDEVGAHRFRGRRVTAGPRASRPGAHINRPQKMVKPKQDRPVTVLYRTASREDRDRKSPRSAKARILASEGPGIYASDSVRSIGTATGTRAESQASATACLSF